MRNNCRVVSLIVVFLILSMSCGAIIYFNNYFKEGYLPIKDEYDVSLITQQEYDEIIKKEEDLKELSKP